MRERLFCRGGKGGFEFVQGLKGRGELGGFGQEDREVVFDGVFEGADFGDEKIALVAELGVGDGADEEVEEGVVHFWSPYRESS